MQYKKSLLGLFSAIFLLVIINTQCYKLNNIYKDPSPPPYKEYAKVARYIVHKSNWTSLGTLSTLKTLDGFPMVSVISIADSPLNSQSTGNIYFLLTILDFPLQDIKKNNRVTMMLSMDQDLTCTSKNVDPMEPTCTRVMLSGSIIKLIDNSDELDFANKSMLSRHPASTQWNAAHNFIFCRLVIKEIIVLDYYGGPQYVDVGDYLNAIIDEYPELDENDSKIKLYTKKENKPNDKEINIRISKNSNIRKINIFNEI